MILPINKNNIDKFFECKEIGIYNQKMDYNVWTRSVLDRLIVEEKIPSVRQIFCSEHNITYEAKPLCVSSVLKQVLYTNCPKCELEAIKLQQNGGISDAEKELRVKQNKEHTIKILLSCGIPPVFFNTPIKYDFGIFEKHKKRLTDRLDTNLIIVGGYGSGKSFFAYELAKLHYTMGLRIQIYSMSVLVGKYINMYKNLESIKNDFDTIDLLILDDLDMIADKDYPILDFLIALFYDMCKKIVFVGNISIDRLKEKLSDKSVVKLKNDCVYISA